MHDIVKIYNINTADKKAYRKDVTRLWSRFTSACHLEKKWMNERLNLYMIVNGILLTALVYISKPSHTGYSLPFGLDSSALTLVLCLFSLSISLATFCSTNAARKMHSIWYKRLAILIDNMDKSIISECELTFGTEENERYAKMAMNAQFSIIVIASFFWTLALTYALYNLFVQPTILLHQGQCIT